MKKLMPMLAIAVLTACVSIKLQQPGPVTVGGLQLTPKESWNILPAALAPFARPGSQVWTRDGVLLDRLIIISGVPEGEPLFKEPNKATALPRFKADMLPDEIVQLTESSIVKLFGEGAAVVKAANLRPSRFGDQRGVTFDLTATPTEGPVYRGMVGTFVAAKQLNMVIYMAADPYYFEKHRGAAESIIASAQL